MVPTDPDPAGLSGLRRRPFALVQGVQVPPAADDAPQEVSGTAHSETSSRAAPAHSVCWNQPRAVREQEQLEPPLLLQERG